MHAGAALAQQSATPLPAGADGAAPGSESAATLRPPLDAGTLDDMSLLSWRIPPIRWGGNTTTEGRLHKVDEQRIRFQQVEHATVRAASYIWQPWFAQVGASVGLLSTHERGGGLPGESAPKTGSNAVTASGTLALFPVSRFPLNAYFERADSRTSGEMVQNETVNTRFGLRQSYTPEEGQSSYSAAYDHSTLASPVFGKDAVNAFNANANMAFGRHNVDLAGGYTSNTRSNTGESTHFARLYGRHRYQPGTTFSVESLASMSATDFNLVSAGEPQQNRSRFLQASSFATWRPGEDSPLFVTGGGRLFHAAIDNHGAESQSGTLTGNVAATYALNANTTLGGSAVFTQAYSGVVNDRVTAQNANVTYVADPRDIRGFLYTWNAAAHAANHTSTLTAARRNAGGQLGHNVTRDFPVNDWSVVTLNLGQNVNSTFDTVTSQSTTLSHTGSVAWRLLPTASATGFFSVLGADSRTCGYNSNEFRLFNVQGTGQIQLSRYAFAAANFTVQAVQHSTPASPAGGFNRLRSGNLSYQHTRVFNVPRLRYYATYNINDVQFASRLQGDVNASREQVTQSFEQRLDYNIGRIEVRLSTRFAVIDGRRNALVYLRIGRQFGQF